MSAVQCLITQFIKIFVQNHSVLILRTKTWLYIIPDQPVLISTIITLEAWEPFTTLHSSGQYQATQVTLGWTGHIFNSLAPWGCKLNLVIFKLISGVDTWSISCRIFLRWPQGWLVNIGSGNGLVQSGNKPQVIWHHTAYSLLVKSVQLNRAINNHIW